MTHTTAKRANAEVEPGANAGFWASIAAALGVATLVKLIHGVIDRRRERNRKIAEAITRDDFEEMMERFLAEHHREVEALIGTQKDAVRTLAQAVENERKERREDILQLHGLVKANGR